jgi:hypothetical protein
MNTREKGIHAASQLILDERLIASFRTIRDNSGVFAVELINEHLANGEQLDEIFYTGKEYRYFLSVKKVSQSSFAVSFGCIAGPDAGDGGEKYHLLEIEFIP